MTKFALLLLFSTCLFFCGCRSVTVVQENKTISQNLGGGVMLELMLIHPGKFLMGSEKENNAQPVHEVTISQPFYLGKYEVTQAQWQEVMGVNPSYFKGASLPVENVSWEDCQRFIEKLNSKGIGTFRLPTEAEWEYACRAGSKDDDVENIDEMGWCDQNSGHSTQPVGTKQPNPWGLYDMYGNVWEWCQDWYAYYSAGKQTDPKGPAAGTGRLCRGGGWSHPSKGNCSPASRVARPPSFKRGNLGFRLVMLLP